MSFVRRHRWFLTRYVFRGRVYVRPERFQENLSKLQEIVREYVSHCYFIALSISPTTSEIDGRSYGFNDNVARYNTILQNLFGDGYVDLDSLLGGDPETYLISDGIHLTKDAHSKISEYLYHFVSHLFQRVEYRR